MFPEEYQTYVNELGETLRTKNLRLVKELHQKWLEKMELAPLPPDDQLEAHIHQLICEFPSLSDLHADSRKWLLEHGYAVHVEGSDEMSSEPKT